jgi:hypothetical protein
MADIADDAQAVMELEQKLLSMANKKPLELPKGSCLECEEPTPGSFCSTDCRDYYERRKKMQSILGRPGD